MKFNMKTSGMNHLCGNPPSPQTTPIKPFSQTIKIPWSNQTEIFAAPFILWLVLALQTVRQSECVIRAPTRQLLGRIINYTPHYSTASTPSPLVNIKIRRWDFLLTKINWQGGSSILKLFILLKEWMQFMECKILFIVFFIIFLTSWLEVHRDSDQVCDDRETRPAQEHA